MKKYRIILFFFLLLSSVHSFAQMDAYPGTWYMDYAAKPGDMPVHAELQISTPEKNVLYPAKLKLQCGGFTGEYELLLVRKNSRELGISKNKYVLSESPFSIGNNSFFLNGTFDFSRDLKGVPTLNIKRVVLKQNSIPFTDSLYTDETNKTTAAQLSHFLKNADIRLYKLNNTIWKDERSGLILAPTVSPAYFGLQDTIHLKSRDGAIHFITATKKKEQDIVSVTLNGRVILDQLELDRKEYIEEIILDTGLNILTFFADNFGDAVPAKGKMTLEVGGKKFSLDFTNRADSAATFIVAKFYCDKDEAKDISFKYNNSSGNGEKKLQDNEKLLGSIISTSRQLTLAIWDDAVEDGDSISININGKFIAKGFPVKKNPQFITVTLNPGPNSITFSADNLGSIPPNTSILEIIDGKKRKSFALETTLSENNLIRIFYDLRPGL